MTRPPPMPLGTPVYVGLSWVRKDGYITKVYPKEELMGDFVWNYYDVVLFHNGWKHRQMFAKYLVNLLTGLREDGSVLEVLG